MIRWPARALKAVRKLFEPLQDIDVFVEDHDDEVFYRRLLNAATNERVLISRVFGLGGRSAVLEAARAYDHQRQRPALFIADGDFGWVRGDVEPVVRRLHVHSAYCVENILLTAEAVAKIGADELEASVTDAYSRIDYGGWLSSVLAQLLELFAAFATVHERNPGVPTIAIGVGNLCVQTSQGTTLDRTKVKAARDEALAAAGVAIDPTVMERYEQILMRIQRMAEPDRAISGKDFLFPLLHFHLNSLGMRLRKKILRLRLVAANDQARFRELGAELIRVSQGVN